MIASTARREPSSTTGRRCGNPREGTIAMRSLDDGRGYAASVRQLHYGRRTGPALVLLRRAAAPGDVRGAGAGVLPTIEPSR